MAVLPPLMARQRLAFFAVALNVFMDALGVTLLLPILPELLRPFGSNAFLLGAFASVYTLAQFISTPVLGSLSDRFGRRPPLILTLVFTGLAYVLLAVGSLVENLPLLFGARILAGLAGGVFAIAQAYIADRESDPLKRSTQFGWIGAAFGLGFLFGPALGGLLSGVNLRLPIWFAAILAFINAALTVFTVVESLPPERRRIVPWQDMNPLKQLLAVSRNPKLRRSLASAFIYNFAFAGFTSLFVLFVQNRFGWTPLQVAGVLIAGGFTSALGQGLIFGRLLPYFQEKGLALLGLGGMAAGYFWLAQVPQPGTQLYPAQILTALFGGFVIPALSGLFSRRVTAEEQGQVLGSVQGWQSLAQVIGPLILGVVYDRGGADPFFWSLAALNVFAILLLLPRSRQPIE
ncbi:MFS transporter [Synechococcus elongatus]|uniref:MFS transporter n=1 Tax=Synechococcus elongatus PCC 11802 TaxID=2283154 RepID=A0AAU6R560_SYNEL|nr:MFS transporter [Synechococcus elongatus]